MRRRNIFFAILGLFSGMVALAIWFAPRVTGDVSSGTTLSSSGPLVVQFNVAIDSDSVADHFLISPNVRGDVRLAGNRLIFVPESAFPFGQPITVTLTRGLLGENSLPLLGDVALQFQVGSPRLLFLREHDGLSNLWMRDDGGTSRQLTDEPYGIWGYSVAPDGRGIVVSSIAADGSDDLVLIDLNGMRHMLLDCMGFQCRDGRWQPGGTLLAYERIGLGDDVNVSEVWLLDTVEGRTWPAYEAELLKESNILTRTGRFPRWSSDGRYLAYFHPEVRLIVILDLHNGSATRIPANLEVMGEWSPVDDILVYTELAFGIAQPHEHVDEAGTVISHTETSLYRHAVVSDLQAGQVRDLSEGMEVNDGKPAWEPTGEALAVGRSVTGGGRQVWIIDLSSDHAVTLTDDPYYHHTALTWSPDGRYLAFMRSGLSNPADVPSVWTLDVESDQMELAAENAFLPGWLP